MKMLKLVVGVIYNENNEKLVSAYMIGKNVRKIKNHIISILSKEVVHRKNMEFRTTEFILGDGILSVIEVENSKKYNFSVGYGSSVESSLSDAEENLLEKVDTIYLPVCRTIKRLHF